MVNDGTRLEGERLDVVAGREVQAIRRVAVRPRGDVAERIVGRGWCSTTAGRARWRSCRCVESAACGCRNRSCGSGRRTPSPSIGRELKRKLSGSCRSCRRGTGTAARRVAARWRRCRSRLARRSCRGRAARSASSGRAPRRPRAGSVAPTSAARRTARCWPRCRAG